tara:strand:- start:1057 stop:1263 length:207 start_codon:yes stop_codon:yes gene_type:complete
MIPLNRLEKELKEMTFPEQVRISKCELITNVPQMIAGHLKVLKGNPGNKLFMPYYERLMLLRFAVDTE